MIRLLLIGMWCSCLSQSLDAPLMIYFDEAWNSGGSIAGKIYGHMVMVKALYL
jgi:hypothetical protein